MLDNLMKSGTQFVWQTGESDFSRVQSAIGGKNVGWVGPFIDKMEYAYAVADVVVSRSGALTIAELTRLGLPAIVIPYPLAAADHQTLNARTLVGAGAAVMVKDSEINQRLESEVLALVADGSRRNEMAAASKRLGRPDAAGIIARKTIECIR